MGIVINQSIKNSLSFYFGMFLGAISTVFVYPNVFNDQPDHWGLIQLIVAYSFIISTFSNFGVPKTFIRFFPIIESPYLQKIHQNYLGPLKTNPQTYRYQFDL